MSSPTAEQLRKARHLGAKAALSHLPEGQRDALLNVHGQLDARRAANVADFKAKALGQKLVS
jgi:hypothetical protein